MHVRTEGWPLVLADDEGIRPGGAPGECSYCHARVGRPHAFDCFTVEKVARFHVLAHGRRVGTYDRAVPHWWDAGRAEVMLNRGSWCKRNAVDQGVAWTDKCAADEAAEDGCCCALLSFGFLEVVDPGPLVTRPGRVA